MRRKNLVLAIAALATLGPIQAWGGDREIAEQIIQRLKTNRDSGSLKDFTLDMKVDQGVVLFRGSVSAADQKSLVLAAANGIDGIAEIVDEVSVTEAAKPEDTLASAESAMVELVAEPELAEPQLGKPEAVAQNAISPKAAGDFSFRQALASEAKVVRQSSRQPLMVVPGVVQPVGAFEETSSDESVVSSVVSALGRAKDAGQLKGFGIDVQCNDGMVELKGRAASAEQRKTILRIAERTPGVSGVRETIAVPTAAPSLSPMPIANQRVETLQAPARERQIPAQFASNSTPRAASRPAAAPLMNPVANPAPAAMPVSQPAQMPMMAMPQRMQQAQRPMQPQRRPMQAQMQGQRQGQMQAMQASMQGSYGGGAMMGQPVPMAPHAPAGAPRYDSPNLPNYAWPGYAAHPNYAAVSYPQQYSPSAWPFIGPFYPYPQVPLGWRKVSLEWDDGWWFLDFTDR